MIPFFPLKFSEFFHNFAAASRLARAPSQDGENWIALVLLLFCV